MQHVQWRKQQRDSGKVPLLLVAVFSGASWGDLVTQPHGVTRMLGRRFVLQWPQRRCSSASLFGTPDASLLCVVGRVHDLIAIERSGAMRGRYFVLGRLLSPLEGVGPEDLPIGALVDRLREDGVTEIILATPPSVDGEATALLLKRDLAELGVRMSRIASGVPHGGDLEFADPITMGRAFLGRQNM